MFKKIYLNHIYSADDKFQFYKSLGKRGFTLEDRETEHPGKAFCRFLSFSENQYLEFVHTKKGGYKFVKPGLSFGYKSNLKELCKKLEKKVSCGYLHKNYEWKKDSESELPGWNFISFKRIPFRTLYVWFTEYESGRKKQVRKFRHSNTVYGIHAIELEMTDKVHIFFENILCKKF